MAKKAAPREEAPRRAEATVTALLEKWEESGDPTIAGLFKLPEGQAVRQASPLMSTIIAQEAIRRLDRKPDGPRQLALRRILHAIVWGEADPDPLLGVCPSIAFCH